MDSLRAVERDERLLERLTLTLEAPDSQPLPTPKQATGASRVVGIDLKETNALGAVGSCRSGSEARADEAAGKPLAQARGR
ncbi:hypothetical protein [Thermogemmatispora tikiterensis]|nr:hypothetical protein [Thermogemmatispora tikiterensis]